MISTHPCKVRMAVLVGVRVKAKVRALARRDAHSFLGPCGRSLMHWTCLGLVYGRLRSELSLF